MKSKLYSSEVLCVFFLRDLSGVGFWLQEFKILKCGARHPRGLFGIIKIFNDIVLSSVMRMRPLYQLIFRLLGWKIKGSYPAGLDKFIVAIAPHTSNWDFMVGIAARSILRMQKAKFLAKNQLFRPPFGWIFRALGGYPVERTSSNDMVRQVADLFNAHDHFILAIAPEGTRRKVDKLRTGFYYIAKAAHVPIIPVGFDYKKKEVIIGTPLYAGDDMDEDFRSLHVFYSAITGKNPQHGFGQVPG